MILLNKPEQNAEEIFNKALKRKSKTNKLKLEGIKSVVFDRFKEYAKYKNNLEDIGESPKCCTDVKQVLIGCYTRNTEYEVGILTSNIISMQTTSVQSKCPHCGLSEPETIDHYLPKDIFPEFSILPINLVPMCGRCNNIKNTDWKVKNNRNSIHFYFDEFIDKKFLYCELIYRNQMDVEPTAKFKLVKSEEITESQFEVIKNHFKTFNLYDRYSKHIVETISCKYETCKESGLSIEINKATLKGEINSKSRRYGVNYWEVCVLEAILNSENFWKRMDTNTDRQKNIS